MITTTAQSTWLLEACLKDAPLNLREIAMMRDYVNSDSEWPDFTILEWLGILTDNA